MGNVPQFDWYLKEWLATKQASNAWLMRETGWTHRITAQLVNRQVRWNRDHLNLAAHVLKVMPFELLLHPDEAMQIRRLRQAVEEEHRLRAVADPRSEFAAAPREDEPLNPRRRVN